MELEQMSPLHQSNNTYIQHRPISPQPHLLPPPILLLQQHHNPLIHRPPKRHITRPSPNPPPPTAPHSSSTTSSQPSHVFSLQPNTAEYGKVSHPRSHATHYQHPIPRYQVALRPARSHRYVQPTVV
ncbi:hypothetical protein K440DRAFT_184892 [Wilcoxina mikolae CBS 423.85]|nr:hypothetical protein K440DRAFT_184892 [Wilcoxina mikolae CBS 423.85]